MSVTMAFMGVGGTQLMLLMGAVLLLFGPKKLPELARGIGRGIREFKKASNDVTEELERTFDEPSPPPSKSFSDVSVTEQSVPRALKSSGPSIDSENGGSAHSPSDSFPPR